MMPMKSLNLSNPRSSVRLLKKSSEGKNAKFEDSMPRRKRCSETSRRLSKTRRLNGKKSLIVKKPTSRTN